MLQTSYSLGLDIGSSSVKLALMDQKAGVIHTDYLLHKGDPRAALYRLLSGLTKEFPVEQIQCCMASGTGSAFLTEEFGLRQANEVAAIVEGMRVLCPQAASIIEIGGQSAKFITGLQDATTGLQFSMNNNCAAGTGSFFEDQMTRLGFPIEDYSSLTEKAVTIPRIAGRCSVFAKTDIIHRQQEGVPFEDILLGLAYAMVRNFKSTIVKNLPVRLPVLLMGGTGANGGVWRAVKEIFHLSDTELLRPEHFSCIQAVGTAVIGWEHQHSLDLEGVLGKLEAAKGRDINDVTYLPKLAVPTGLSPDMHLKPWDKSRACFLGIDVGSTSTNLVLIDGKGAVVDYQYLLTRGNPQKAVEAGLASLRQRFGEEITITAVGTTGSGRYLIGKKVGADVIKDEITAQAKAAVFLDPAVDTIFEIGGQDSKYIRCENGVVADFQMNKICAAGTGSFLEEQAERFAIPIKDFGSLALAAPRPVDLGERCTVFIETNISTCLSRGISKENIVAGLCYSIVRNYLHKVVGNKPTGKRISLQGGVAGNPGIVAAFRHFFGDKLVILPFFSVSGAYGAALLAKGATVDTKPLEISQENFLHFRTEELFLKNYQGNIDPAKETIGVPRALMMHKLFPLVNAFFQELGYNVLLSDPTSENTVRLSQEYSREETCYPVKLVLGHMAELADKKVNYIFLPSVHTMKHELSRVRHNYGCVYMQTAPQIAARALGLKEKGIRLLNPVLSLDFGKRHMAKTMIGLGRALGKSKACGIAALLKGARALREFTMETEALGAEIINDLTGDEKVFVLITRNYGLADPVLNMGIAEAMVNMGYKVINLSHLPAHNIDISNEYPNLYWPFGQHIMAGAELVRAHPNLYAIFLTNHGCGPDTMLSHLFREQMAGKSYLAIEVDEHASRVGVMTRIEAFINSLQAEKKAKHPAEPIGNYLGKIAHPRVKMESGLSCLSRKKEIVLPYLFPYADLVCAGLRQRGYRAKVVPATGAQSIAKGRSLTLSKEYLSYTALLGDMLLEAERGGGKQFIIPQTEGSEADGQYSRLIRSKLDKAGYQEIELLAPCLEKLPDEEGIEHFLITFVAGDIILSSSGRQRQELLAKALELIASGKLNSQSLISLADAVGKTVSGKQLLVTGEPYAMFNSSLNNGTLDALEAAGYVLRYSPLSEYFCFLWNDSAGSKKAAKQVLYYAEIMSQISDHLGSASPFSPDFAGLVDIADRQLQRFAGGNGRYRYAKANQGIAGVSGILSISSMYENTATVLSLLSSKTALPVLELAFDGNPNNNDGLKLSSFLYYLKE